MLVAMDEGPVFRRAYGMADAELDVPMRSDHVLATGSITKQFTAVAILQLVSQGLVALDDDVRAHTPHIETHGRAVTIEQLLTHTSGLPNIVDREDFDELARQDFSLGELLALTKDMPPLFEPGEGFHYSDSGYFALAAVIEGASGLGYAEYMEARLFRPLGMADTWCADRTRIIPRRATGYSVVDGLLVHPAPISMTVPHAAGGVFSTVDDLLRWDRALREGAVVPRELLDRAWSARTLPGGARSGYGFGWKICTLAGRATIEHGGYLNGYLAQMLRLPDDGVTIIVLANNDADMPDPGSLARRIARLLLTDSAEPQYHALTSGERAVLAGTYEISPGGDVREILDIDGVLHVRRGGGQARPLTALSPTELTRPDGDESLVFAFELGPDGIATAIRVHRRCEPIDVAVRISAR